MEESLRKDIDNSPLKKKYIAKHIGVNPTVFSLCLKGERHLNPDKEKQLKDLLKKVS